MIRYEVSSSITHPNVQTTEQRYVVVSTASDATMIELKNESPNLGAKARPHACKHLMQNEVVSTMRWQTNAEPSSTGKVSGWLSVNPTVNQFVADFKRSEPTAIDEVKNTRDLIYSWEHSGQGKIASFYVVYFVEQCFRLRAYDQVNRILREVDLSLLTEWSMIALLRSSFVARSFLPAWPRLLSSVHDRLHSQGKDPNRLLRGLNRK